MLLDKHLQSVILFVDAILHHTEKDTAMGKMTLRTVNIVCAQAEKAYMDYLLACEAEVFGASQYQGRASSSWDIFTLHQGLVKTIVSNYEELHTERCTKILNIKQHRSYESY